MSKDKGDDVTYQPTGRKQKKNGEPAMELRDRPPQPSAEEKASRREINAAAADIAMKDHNEREKHKYENMQRLKAERLARAEKIASDD